MTLPTWKWGGSAIAQTASSGATWTVHDFRPPVWEPSLGVKENEVLDAAIDIGAAHPRPQNECTIVVEVDASAIGASNTDENLHDAWQELTEFFDPLDGVQKLEATRQDAASANVVRHLWCQVIEVPSFRYRTGDPSDQWSAGGYHSASGRIFYPVRLSTMVPYWQIATLDDQDTSPADAELAISGSTDTVTIANAGRRWVGLRIDVSAVSGTVTQVTIDNQTNGTALIVKDTTALANSDYFDWLATDPRAVTKTDSANRWGLGSNFKLDPGNNTLQSTRDSGTGTCTFSLSWPALHWTY